MHIRRSGVIRATVLLLAGVTLTTSVFAAEIEEITVTARKRVENLQDIPMVITAISAEAIERKGISDLADIAKYSSGVMLDEGFNKQDTRVVIRGLSPTRGRQNVAILLDDVDISSLAQATAGGSFVINPRLMDVERIEIVKGPHSALFGRSAFNGAIHYITRKPSEDFAANAQLDVGTYSKFEGRGSIRGSLIEDKLTGGLNVAAWGADGFYTSTVTGRSLGGGSGWGAAAALRFTPTDNLSFTLRTEVSEDRYEPEAATVKKPSLVALPSSVLVPVNGLPAVVGAAVAANPANAFFPQTVGSLGSARNFPNPAPSRNPRTGTDYPGSNRDISRTILRGDWDFGPVVLSSISGYGDNKTFQFNDALAVGDFADPLVNGGQETYFDTQITTISEEIRLQSQSEGRFNWTLGGLYWTEELEQINRALRCASAGGDCARVFQSVGTAARTPEDFTRRNTYHSSVYGLADFKITDKLSVGLELRSTKEKENTQAQGVVGPPSPIGCPSVTTNGRIFGANGVVSCAFNATGGINPATGLATVAPQSAAAMNALLTTSTPRYAQVESSFTTPRVSLDYKFAPGKMAYVSYAEGKKPGGLSPLTGIANLAANTYLPEELAAYEIGAKTNWLENRLQLNAAIYYQDYSKKQVSITFVDPGTGQLTTQVVNAASASVKGFELELNAAPTDNWTLTAGYTYNDGKYEDFTDIQTGVSAISRAVVNNPNACTVIVVSGTNRCSISYAGNRLEGAPKSSLLMGTEVRGNWRDDMDWFFNLDTRYQSDRFTSFENSLVMDAYWLADVRLGLKSGKKWTLTAYINNLFDDDTLKASAVYIQDWNIAYAAGAAGTVRTPIAAQAPSGARAVLPDRRQLGLRASFNFSGDKPPPVIKPSDSDGDGVTDDIDRCPGTPAGTAVDASGCPLPKDSDGDGVMDPNDKCPNTPAGQKVDASGCELDDDGDGVINRLDQCPMTPAGAKVVANGCELDDDGDGVVNSKDQCADTPKGDRVDSYGCSFKTELRLPGVVFETNSADLKAESLPVLDGAVATLKRYPELIVEVAGHTDNVGSDAFNLDLSRRRAATVLKYLQDNGAANSLKTRGYGERQPVASNKTDEGRQQNRRVVLRILNK